MKRRGQIAGWIVSRPRARLVLERKTVVPGGELSYVIVNNGKTPLLFGAGYGFERRTVGVWRPRPTARAFAAWGRQVSPTEISTPMVARVPPDFEPGPYRLTTNLTVLHADGSPVRKAERPVNIAISCAFLVERSAR